MERVRIAGVEAEVARSFGARVRGLIGRRGLAPGTGLLILKCNAIHTPFLDAQDRVVRVVRNIRPWRLFVWGGWRARKVLETASRRDGDPLAVS